MRILIYGSREFAVTVAELIRHCGHETVGMIDDYNTGPDVLGSLESVSISHPPAAFGLAVAIGYRNLSARWAAWTRAKAIGYSSPPLIHPRSYVADSAHVADGVMVMAGALVDVGATIDELAVVWPGACVSHHARLGRNSFLSPSATLCGYSVVGSDSFIGAGAVVIDHCSVPAQSFIKALQRTPDRKV